MTVLGQYAYREVMYSQIFDYNSSTPLLYLDFPNSSSLEVEAETVYATGGRGGPNLVSFSGNRQGTFTIESQIFTMQTLAIMTGSEVLTEDTNIFRVDNRSVREVAGDMVVSLEKTPDGDLLPSVFKFENGVITTPVSVVSVNGNELELDPVEVEDGDEVQVFYQWKPNEDVYNIHIDADKFPPYLRLVNEVFLTDRTSGVVVDAQMLLHKAKAQPAFTLEGSNTGDPTSISMVFDLFNNPLPNGREAMIDLSIYNN